MRAFFEFLISFAEVMGIFIVCGAVVWGIVFISQNIEWLL